jgi:hypothetical protein
MDTTKAMLNWNPIPDDLATCQERLDSPGQLHFSFTLGDPLDEETLSALEQLEQAEEEFVEEIIRRRKKRKNRPCSEELPAHLERRIERIEPTLPADWRLRQHRAGQRRTHSLRRLLGARASQGVRRLGAAAGIGQTFSRTDFPLDVIEIFEIDTHR